MQRILSLLLVILAWGIQAAPAEIEHFSKNSQFHSVKISPDGKHLAVITPHEGKNVLAILAADTLKPTYLAKLDGNNQVGAYHWANDERVIFRLETFSSWYEQPRSNGEWLAVNVNGKRKKNIFGVNAGNSGLSSHVGRRNATMGSGQVVDLLPDEPKSVLIASTPFLEGKNPKPTLYKVNIYSGRKKQVARAPVPHGSFLTDHQGRARFSFGLNDKDQLEIYYREDDKAEWRLVAQSKAADSDFDFSPLAFADEHRVYALDRAGESRLGLYLMDMRDGSRELLYRDERVDPSDFYLSADGRKLYGLEVMPDVSEVVYIDNEAREAQLMRGLDAAFPDHQVRITSTTADGSKAIVVSYSAQDPGTFYLYDGSNNTVRHLTAARPWVKPTQSAQVKPISLTTRDGVEIHGYLTLPNGAKAEKLPLVVNPHGGPHGPRDEWGYNPETQLLASRGMAVLQVNFRGSGGYGKAFEESGYRKWGQEIQYDIIDATEYVIAQGIADPERICIYGASFGGYSALQSAVLAPELFACSVGFVGIYDMELMFKKGDTTESTMGMKILDKYLGSDKEQLRAFSPIHHLDKLKAAVMIIHGKEDVRAPIEHAYALRDGLEAIDYPYEWMVMEKEGHGFYNEDNRAEMYAELLGFLEQHLKL
ncbi:S9 family peptidase [Ferrimonas marina]|uniref:Dipeptidyl aminopeptidase/acylaminoacyl peptidase n=1 Tax=Ferrimonas marina TaxID=299255 RepID=A0A1M5VCI0_9GAMM|nr:S9 family peptidase [Ferrimonas marina]SHH72969.1 Dipeptidyl aminopeptidase/acylaminoacyl peptidase [Ferrimonas marina]